MNESLSSTLKNLRLSGMAETLDVRLQEAQGNHLTHAEFLELVMQDEMLVRRERKLARRLKAASFRDLKSLEDFDWSFNRSIKKSEIYELATGRFIGDV
jgi:DNA replication protein DnaC